MADPLLELRSISQTFGGLRALDNVELSVPTRATAGLIGPNGAGKTTLFNVVTGFLSPDQGSVFFSGEELSGRPPHEIAQLGLVRTFQRARPLTDLTVLENAMAGAFRHGTSGPFSTIFGLRSARREEAAIRHKANELLDRVGLNMLPDEARPDELTAGQLRLLEIARVLATEPEMVLLDEPAAGLSRSETSALADVIQSLPDQGITCLLVEHDVELVFQVCEEVTVLDFGKVIARGSPSAVRGDPAVLNSYLGKGDNGDDADG
ncbi:MAG: ATP-binding cassette domain-containing protein [Acidimicrobiia bacterium]|nr:ATP-binding cassette domain-containing protein [Acidimicrobiia bacterium]